MPDPMPRRLFLGAAGGVGLAALLPQIAQSVGPHHSNPDNPLPFRNADDGEVYLIGERRGRVVIKIAKRDTGVGSMSLITEDITPNDAIPVHKHGAEEELMYIAHGDGVLTLGDDEHQVSRGAMALVPRGVWHGLRNDNEAPLQLLAAYTPGGFEEYFRAIGAPEGQPWKGLTPDDWSRINANFRVTYR